MGMSMQRISKAVHADCGTAFRMQAIDDPARRADNPSPKAPVPYELIEWQCAYHQEVRNCMLLGVHRRQAAWHAPDELTVWQCAYRQAMHTFRLT